MFVQVLLMFSQIALAEPTEDSTEKVEAEINDTEIQAFYEAKKEEDTGVTVDLFAEEDFEMDLSGLNAIPVETPVESDTINSLTEPIATTQMTPVETLDWNLDLTEDLEIGDGNLKIAPEPKSEPVNLDFLDEDEKDAE